MSDSLLLGPEARRAILAETYLDPARELHLRELVRLTGFAPRSIQVEVDRLVRAGLLLERRDGNRRYLRANVRYALFRQVRDIVRVTHADAARTAPAGPVTRRQHARIGALCRRHGVRRLELAGSAARGDFDPDRSDIDLVVEFLPDLGRPALDAYFGLKEGLEALFGRPVDLIMAGAVTNPFVRAGLEQDRQVLYAA